MEYILIIVNIITVPVLSPLAVGTIRKVKAVLQNRRGASIFQPYFDLMKLFHKSEVVSEDASWIFMTAPYVVCASSITLAMLTPIVPIVSALSLQSDIIAFISFAMIGTFFLSISGLDTGNAFGDIGASREMTVAAIAEGGMLFSLFTVALIAGSTNMTKMLVAAHSVGGIHAVALFVSGVAFFIVLLAENARYPFDNPSTHLELTMIHEATIIENSGIGLGLMEWAAANKLFVYIIIFVNIFMPWGVSVPVGTLGILLYIIIVLVKVGITLIIIACIESMIPKLRFFKLPELLFTSYALGVTALVMAIM